ncbi:UDP-N-acetylmuramoyl-L-alanyl-D-glutamate--2,6-diaminopimelate ligase [uncultured Friedmanniella sp.]|uniref:UDP-N-acetylmuramoyl-L-alanyl-D-glutamate--2, 6-diaminopimelate ligase n=1 Tax=uncultured Friedmanniella sp. TaxID=335381 RepID=UPI0035C94ADE
MPLQVLATLAGSSVDARDAAVEVSGITLDSRLVAPGDLYVALPGQRHHGATFGAAAAEAGAVAVLTDPAGLDLATRAGLPVLVADAVRAVMAQVAAEVYGRPAERLTMFGITGTNGKTTTSFLLDAALRAAGHRTGNVGTIGFLLDGRPLDAARTTVTTPESPELQALLAHLAEAGADAVVMEVSSHALVLGRVDAIDFDVAAFTNFGRDHLDFHGDEESYFAAKAQLFTPARTRRVVLNLDDPRGRQLLAQVRRTSELEVRTVSLLDDGADYRACSTRLLPDGETAVVAIAGGREVTFTLRLPGDFNVRNALTALAMVELAGFDVTAAAAGLGGATVPGRMERVPMPAGAPAVVVDFAHTPQAVAAALRALHGRRCVVVLGCGGDRDPDKRAPMGAAAAADAAVVVVTDDNPRSEDPAAIREIVLRGARAEAGLRGARVIDGGDRRSAIRQALALAGPDDVVAVLGKGHETGQQVGAQVLPFADAAVVREEWDVLSREGPS